MASIPDHDAYIAAAPETLRPLLVDLRALLTRALPDAEETIQYDMPGFQIGDATIVGYAAFTKQCGIYVSQAAIEAKADEIEAAGLKATLRVGSLVSPARVGR